METRLPRTNPTIAYAHLVVVAEVVSVLHALVAPDDVEEPVLPKEAGGDVRTELAGVAAPLVGPPPEDVLAGVRPQQVAHEAVALGRAPALDVPAVWIRFGTRNINVPKKYLVSFQKKNMFEVLLHFVWDFFTSNIAIPVKTAVKATIVKMPSKRPFLPLFLPDVLQRHAVLRAQPPVHGYDGVVDQVGHRQPVEHLLH